MIPVCQRKRRILGRARIEIGMQMNTPTIPASLLQTLLDRLGVAADGAALARACEATADVSPSQPVDHLRVLLTQAGVKGVQPVDLSWRRFDPRRLPALLCHHGQWLIAEGKQGDEVMLLNAAGERLSIDDGALQDARLIWLRPPMKQSTSPTNSLQDNHAARLVWQAMMSESGWLSKTLIATIIINFIAVATSLFAMQVYDRVVPTLAYATLTTLVAGMLIILTLDWMLKILRARILDSLAISVDKRVSQTVFDHLLHLRLDVQPRSLGTLAAQVGGLESVRHFFTAGVIFGLIDLPFALLFLCFIAVIGGNVGWVYALLLLVALLLGLTTQAQMRELMRRQMLRQNERQGVLVDVIRGAESIRANHAAWRFSEEWQAITASIDAYSIQQKAIGNFSSVTTGTLSNLAYVAAVVVGVWQIESGLMTMGGMVACSILGGRVIGPIAQAVQYLTQWQGVRQSLRMVDQVLRLERERRDDQHLLLPQDSPNSVALEQVSFVYPESPVRQLNIGRLTFKAGERVLLLGSVGCGKSTLLKVLAGLYRPSEGRVRLGDADLWEIDPQVVASQIGYLPQTVHLFKGSLRGNLALAGTSGDSRLLKVTRDLGIDAIAAGNPLGMEMPISEGGEGLSGGQRQLVALARVVAAQPTLWLLDEPTAALDADSEARVWAVLQENIKPEDIVVVATHRPMQAMKLATRIILLQQGEILKDGAPEVVLPQVMGRGAAVAVNTGVKLHGI